MEFLEVFASRFILSFMETIAVVAVVVANMTPNTACIAFKLDQIK